MGIRDKKLYAIFLSNIYKLMSYASSPAAAFLPGCRATVTTSLETIVTPPKKFYYTGHHLKSPTYFDKNLIVVTISARNF